MLTEEIEGSFPQVYAQYLKKICFTFFYALDSEFITSDVPVCLGDDRTISDEDKTCLYFVLSPKIAVLFGNYSKFKIHKNRMIKVESEIVDLFNTKAITHHSCMNMLIGSSQELIERYL